MILFRLYYLRKSTPCSCTFGAPDLIAAMDFYELWEKMNPGVKEIEMISLPPSRFGRSVFAAGRTRAEREYFGNSRPN